MNIIVLNGSPKGKISVTMQYMAYMTKTFPQHHYSIIDISLRIKKIETSIEEFSDMMKQIQNSDLVIWAFPVYYLLVPAQYKRFIELIFERDQQHIFSGKYSTCFTTSIHFFDHTAHHYIESISHDLNMHVLRGYSASMMDLTKQEEKKRLTLFWENIFDLVQKKFTPQLFISKMSPIISEYHPTNLVFSTLKTNKKVLIVTDSDPHSRNNNLNKMIKQFSSYVENNEILNLHDLHMKGGCLGCLRCAYDNHCVYGDTDLFYQMFEDKIKKADIIIYAGEIKDRYLSSLWKMFFDRSFYNGHVPCLTNKQMGYIISGSLNSLSSLREILFAQVELQHANFVGIVTDEPADHSQIDHYLYDLAYRTVTFSEQNYIQPPSFASVSGRKLFRDDIWSELRFPFIADYKAFKRLGLFDFPKMSLVNRLIQLLMISLSRIPAFRKEINKRMKEEMIKPLQREL